MDPAFHATRDEMNDPLEISVQGTPNPHAVKFTLNRAVATQGTTYRRAPSASAPSANAAVAEPPWAAQLLEVSGITQIFALNNFMSITKTPEADWKTIAPQVERILRQAFQ